MKKVILLSAISASILASEISDKALDLIKSMMPSDKIEIKLENTEKLDDTGFEMIEFGIYQDGNKLGEDIVFSNGVILSPEIVNIKSSKNYKLEYSQKKEEQKKAQIVGKIPNFLKEHKDIVIFLGDSKASVADVVFSDPDCPYCRKHLEYLMQTKEIKPTAFILTPLPMHKDALAKSVLILDEIKKAKNDKDKLEVLKKYFAQVDFKAPVNDKLDKYKKVTDVIFYDLGISATPSIFENVKIK